MELAPTMYGRSTFNQTHQIAFYSNKTLLSQTHADGPLPSTDEVKTSWDKSIKRVWESAGQSKDCREPTEHMPSCSRVQRMLAAASMRALGCRHYYQRYGVEMQESDVSFKFDHCWSSVLDT